MKARSVTRSSVGSPELLFAVRACEAVSWSFALGVPVFRRMALSRARRGFPGLRGANIRLDTVVHLAERGLFADFRLSVLHDLPGAVLHLRPHTFFHLFRTLNHACRKNGHLVGLRRK